MTIIRTKHNVQKKYTILNNETLRDPRLSLEAVGLWARLLSRPDDWEISVQELKKSCSCGENKIYKLLNELIGLGYVYRSQKRKVKNNKSVFGKFEYIVFENREEMESFQKSFLLDDFQDAEIQDAENGGITNTVAKPSTEKTNRENIKRRKHGEYVEFSEQEYEALKQEYGAKELDDVIKDVDHHCVNNRGKGYKNYVLAIHTFFRRRKKEASSNRSSGIPKPHGSIQRDFRTGEETKLACENIDWSKGLIQ